MVNTPLHKNTSIYLIALGANKGRSADMPPRQMVKAAMAALDEPPCRLLEASSIIETAPVGPAIRRFSNAAAIISSPLPPPALLSHLKLLERRFGRKAGKRWGDRPLDLDIILWGAGSWRDRTLHIPHKLAHIRDFVLVPAASIAPNWRLYNADLPYGPTLHQLLMRIKRPKPVDH